MSTDVRTARHGAEDGFHEIQLSGKQLVFLFMATTIVSIVIFLCGVLVGRGARVDVSAEVMDASATAEQPGQLQPSSGEPVVSGTAPPAASAEPGKPTKVESGDFNYMEMLTAEQSKDEVPQPPAEPVAESAAATAPPPSAGKSAEAAPAKPVEAPATSKSAPAPAPAAPAAAATAPAAVPATSGDLTIQVAAVKTRSEADRIASRLQKKGYQAYVADPAPGTPMYRVRVGHYGDKAEANKTASRLAKEEKFRPWVTR